MKKLKAGLAGMFVAAALVMPLVGATPASAEIRKTVTECPQGGTTPSDPNYNATKPWCIR
jgi:hypothetical protein